MSPRNSKATPARLLAIRESGHNSKKAAEATSARNPLAALFLKLIIATGAADQGVWNKLMFKYLSDVRNAIPRNKKDQATAKGNLQKEILKDELTFNVLVKGMRFLDFGKVKIIIEGTLNDTGETIRVDHSMNLGERIIVSIDDEGTDNAQNEGV